MKKLQERIQKSKKVGLFGGTFDPVHNGHLIISKYILEKAGLDIIVFIPSANPPHKSHELMFGPDERYKMLAAALKKEPDFAVSDIEMKRKGFSFTIDTIRTFRKLMSPDAELYFIIGKDTLYEIKMWKDPEDIIKECTLLVADRVCHNERTVPGWITEKARFIETPLIEISSTEIKKRIAEFKSIRSFVPDKVADMIEKKLLQK